MIRVLVVGGFDPFPHRGHRSHFKMAKALFPDVHLIVAVNTDRFLLRKKGMVCTSLEDRIDMIKDLPYVDEVVTVIDEDQTVAETLRWLKPDIFAKGGDRTPYNMPQAELDVCKELGIEIRYGVCDPELERYSTGTVPDVLRRISQEDV